MAPVAMIIGSISGTVSALAGWLLFGLGLWGAVQVYFVVGVIVAAALIAVAMLRPKPQNPSESASMQRA